MNKTLQNGIQISSSGIHILVTKKKKKLKFYCLRLFNWSKLNIQEHMFGIYMTQLIPTCRLSLIHGKVSSWPLLLRGTIRSIQTGKHEPRECTFTAEVLSGPICPGISLASFFHPSDQSLPVSICTILNIALTREILLNVAKNCIYNVGRSYVVNECLN